MGQQNTKEFSNQRYSIQFIEKFIVSSTFRNGYNSYSSSPDFFVGDAVIIFQKEKELKEKSNIFSKLFNKSKENIELVDQENNDIECNLSQISESCTLPEKVDSKESSSNSLDHLSSSFETIDLNKENHSVNLDVFYIESVESNPNDPNSYLLKLNGLDEHIPSTQVRLLTTEQNRIRHHYHWLAFLYLDLCHSLNEIERDEMLKNGAFEKKNNINKENENNKSLESLEKDTTIEDYISVTSDLIPEFITPNSYFYSILKLNALKGTPIHRLDFSQNMNDSQLTELNILPILFIIRRLKHLIRLDMKGCGIHASFCENLLECFLNGVGPIRNDKNTEIGVIGESISKVSNLHMCLSELDLSFNCLKLEGAKFISEILKLKTCSLHYLNLECTDITPEGCSIILKTLLDNTNSVLVKLDLRQCGVSDEQIKLAYEVAKVRKSFCYFESYPYLKQNNQNDNTSKSKISSNTSNSWLSMSGWNNFSKLRDILSSNIEEVKKNPEILTLSDTGEADQSIKRFISYARQSYFSKIFFGSSNSLESNLNNSSNSLGSNSGSIDIKHKDLQQNIETEENSSIDVSKSLESSRSIDLMASFDEDMVNLVKSSVDEKNSSLDLKEESTITCKICFDDVPLSDIYIMDICEHKFCLTCLYQYLSSKINSFETDTIKCPSCNRQMEQSEIKQILELLENDSIESRTEGGLFDKFLEFSLKKTLSQMKGLIWCPNPKCDNAMIINEPQHDNHNETPTTIEDSCNIVHEHEHSKQEISNQIQVIPIINTNNMNQFEEHPSSRNDKISKTLMNRFYPELNHNPKFNNQNRIPIQTNRNINTIPQSNSQINYNQHSIFSPQPYNPIQPNINNRHFYEPRFNANQQGPKQYIFNQDMRANIQLNANNNQPSVQRVSKKLLNRFYGSILMENEMYGQEYKNIAYPYFDYNNQNQSYINNHNLYFNSIQQNNQQNDIQNSLQKNSNQNSEALPIEKYKAYRVECSECHTEICSMCKLFYHPGVTCEAFKKAQESVDDSSLDIWKKSQNAKDCPQCKCLIMKNGGCNHMTCRHCNCDFCWICGKVLVGEDLKNHFGLYFGCKKWNVNAIFS